MIKGRYVAQIEVDFEYDGSKITYDVLHDRIYSEWIDKTVNWAVAQIFANAKSNIKVTKQWAEVTDVEQEVEQ